jgi:hypothetical protein
MSSALRLSLAHPLGRTARRQNGVGRHLRLAAENPVWNPGRVSILEKLANEIKLLLKSENEK